MMSSDSESNGSRAGALFGRAPPPRVLLPDRGVAIGFFWSGAQGAGNQILSAKIELSRDRAKLVAIQHPFSDAPGRKDVRDRFQTWLSEESRWAEGRIVVGLDFPFSLAETHLRQLGLLRQALRGPAVLGRGLEERFLASGTDFTQGCDAFRAELGKERPRLADCYRAAPCAPTHSRVYRQAFFGLSTLAHVEAIIPPWDRPAAGKPTLVEVLPGHVARVLCGVCDYRDDSRDGTNREGTRAAILRTLRSAAKLEFEMEQAARVVEDERGGALEAVMAAVAAAAAQEAGFTGVPANVPRSEGWIYSVSDEPWRNVRPEQ
jgi:hypothetical protein